MCMMTQHAKCVTIARICAYLISKTKSVIIMLLCDKTRVLNPFLRTGWPLQSLIVGKTECTKLNDRLHAFLSLSLPLLWPMDSIITNVLFLISINEQAVFAFQDKKYLILGVKSMEGKYCFVRPFDTQPLRSGDGCRSQIVFARQYTWLLTAFPIVGL